MSIHLEQPCSAILQASHKVWMFKDLLEGKASSKTPQEYNLKLGIKDTWIVFESSEEGFEAKEEQKGLGSEAGKMKGGKRKRSKEQEGLGFDAEEEQEGLGFDTEEEQEGLGSEAGKRKRRRSKSINFVGYLE